MMPIVYNHTFTKVIENFSFDYLPRETLIEIFTDGRHCSPFLEKILAKDYHLKHITGCKGYDFVDSVDESIKYDEKTFTKNGCDFTPSNMKGQGRAFDKAVFDEKSKRLNYIIVSNFNFPEIKIRFVKGEELAARYPNGKIPFREHDTFFS
jgi:hypothetical protein